MKKALCIVLSLASVLVLFSACGTKGTDEFTTRPATQDETTLADESTTVNEAESKTEQDSSSAQTTKAAQSKYPYMAINNKAYVVTAKEGFGNRGFTTLICDSTDTYSFNSSASDTSWNVYILNKEFNDAVRYLPQSNSPALSGNGSIKIKEGQYVYLECSCNDFTAGSPNGAYLEITRGKTASTTKAATTAASKAEPIVKPGTYQDEYSQRASAEVSYKDGIYTIRVFWSSSAFEMNEWIMNAEADEGILIYPDCKKLLIETDETQAEKTTTVYENVDGYFLVKNGKLYWSGASEESCRDCVFAYAG